jgi:hypothetical protein
MPVIYGIDEGERVVYLTTTGEPSFSEWRGALLAVFSDPSFRTGFDFISDRRRAKTPCHEFVEQEVDFVREHERELGHCRWAVVVSDQATEDVARAVTMRAGLEGIDVGFFYDLAEARRWVFARG